MIDAAVIGTVRARLDAAGLAGTLVMPGGPAPPAGAKGAYVLLVRLDRPLTVEAGPAVRGHLAPGTYLYAGSARGPGGLAARIRRHFRTDKRVHWHIDRLTLHAGSLAAIAVAGGDECRLAEQLLKAQGVGIALEGFGSTDCRTCRSHLLAIR